MPRGGFDPVILPWHAEAEEMWNDGISGSEIGRKFGVTKNTILGLAHRRCWTAHAEYNGYEPSTLFTRLDAVHAKFDRLSVQNERRRQPVPV